MKIIKSLKIKTKIKRKIKSNEKDLKEFCKKNNAKPVNLDELKKFKTSDTMCVLASGTSINSISKSQWSFIHKNDSISLNNTILHKHIPTYLFYETDSDQKIHRSLNELKFKNLLARKADLSKTPIIWHFQNKRYFDINALRNSNLIDNSFFQGSFSLPGESLEEFDQSLTFCLDNSLVNSPSVGLYRRGSLARIIHFCVAMNYNRIIFYGADLTGSEYFFDRYSMKEFPPGCSAPNLQQYTYNSSEGKKQQSSVHMTVDPSVHPLTMINIIERMDKKWCKPLGVKLEVFNKESALASVIGLAEHCE